MALSSRPRERIIVDWGAGTLPWPLFSSGLNVRSADSLRAATLPLNRARRVLGPDAQVWLVVKGMERSRNSSSDQFSSTSIRLGDIPEARRLQSGEKYFAVDHTYNNSWFKDTSEFRFDSFYPVQVTGQELHDILNKEFPGKFGGFLQPKDKKLPFEKNSVDELHLHWVFTSLSYEPGRRLVSFDENESSKPSQEQMLRNVASFFNEAKRVLKSDGSLVVSDLGELYPFEQFKEHAEKHGFTVVSKGGLSESLRYTLSPLFESPVKNRQSAWTAVLERKKTRKGSKD